MPLTIKGKSGSDVIRSELDRVLAEAERVAKELGALERRLAKQGHWLDTHPDHGKFPFRFGTWADGLHDREALYDQIGILDRQAENLKSQAGECDPARDVWYIKNLHAPCIGIFFETSDFAHGEPEQYAPQGWRPEESS